MIHPGYTAADQRAAKLNDHELGSAYVRHAMQVQGALFLIRLEHPEGEFAVGLGRRNFNDTYDTDKKICVEWFERKNKKSLSWGKQPAFRLAPASYVQRKVLAQTSVELLSDILPIAVKVTPGTVDSNEPSLSQDCMSALRQYLNQQLDGAVDSEFHDDIPICDKGSKQRRKAQNTDDSD